MCHSYLVWLIFEDFIAICTCFHLDYCYLAQKKYAYQFATIQGCSFIRSSRYDAMNFKNTGAIAAFGDYTESQLTVGITDLHCNGSEASILNCSHNNLEEYNCASHDDAGVICQGQLFFACSYCQLSINDTLHTMGSLMEQGIQNNSSWYCSNVTLAE